MVEVAAATKVTTVWPNPRVSNKAEADNIMFSVPPYVVDQ